MLGRWKAKCDSGLVRSVVCIGDSITYAPSMPRIGVLHSWVAQLADALERTTGARAGDGFRGLWHRDEWTIGGDWTKTTTSDAFDVVPFGFGLYSSATTLGTITWHKPTDVSVGAFDLVSFDADQAGDWQYRVDWGEWHSVLRANGETDVRLHRVPVGREVNERVDIRGFDGVRPAVAAIAGIETYRSSAGRKRGALVHNLGYQEQLLHVFCRPSSGRPLAFLDECQPDLVIVFFSNDVRLHDPRAYGNQLVDLVAHVAPYADVLILSPFEQRPSRRVEDAQTSHGSRTLVSDQALFFANDAGVKVSGTNMRAQTRIASVKSARAVLLSTPATGSAKRGIVNIDSVRSVDVQAQYRAAAGRVEQDGICEHVDLYQAWRAAVGPGWESAHAAGWMYDALHPTQRGHDDIATRVCALLGLRHS